MLSFCRSCFFRHCYNYKAVWIPQVVNLGQKSLFEFSVNMGLYSFDRTNHSKECIKFSKYFFYIPSYSKLKFSPPDTSSIKLKPCWSWDVSYSIILLILEIISFNWNRTLNPLNTSGILLPMSYAISFWLIISWL